MSGTASSKMKGQEVVFFGVLFLAGFIFLWIAVNPQLLYQRQQPAFFTGCDHLQKYLSYSGGAADYVANLLSQFYTYRFLGALLITLVIAAITFSAHRIFKIFNSGAGVTFVTFALAGLLFCLHAGYFYTLAYSLAILFPLLGFLLFASLQHLHAGVRLALYFLLTAALYALSAAPFLIFAVLAVLYELFMKKERWEKIPLLLFFIAIPLLWPHIAFYLSLFSRSQMYTYLLPFSLVHPIRPLPWLIYGLLLVFPLLFSLRQVNLQIGAPDGLPKKVGSYWRYVILLLLALALGISANYSLDKKHRLVLTIDRSADTQSWSEIIREAGRHPDVMNRLITLQFNRALYHTGKLCDELFSYPQIEGEEGLYRNSGPAFDMSYALAQLIYEMGNLNSAQVWANEALSIEGASPRVLQLLALIHLQKEEYASAQIYLNKLAKTLLHRKWASKYAEIIDHPERKNDPEFAMLKRSPLSSNFLIRFGFAYGELVNLNQLDLQNRMAFEYCIAYNLLARRLDRFMEFLPQMTKFWPDGLPRHVEEALILIGMSGAVQNMDMMKAFQLLKSNVDKFDHFMSIIAKHNNQTQYAQAELLRQHGDTYWYYHLYHKPRELQK
ncbi:hypothetical protein JXA02_08705 [candidate division KSB1 bacterium]|nr:hypothetical protein [candidate division KSB1 bacterium]RQW05166.1 MAG: hypothetical protein EH222_10275 [candidate division KSB1 bacterium]